MSKIFSGPGGLGGRRKNPKNCYGTRSTGKVMMNGGFNHAPTVDYAGLGDKFDKAFPNAYKPSWMREEEDGEED